VWAAIFPVGKTKDDKSASRNRSRQLLKELVAR
jgi:hypothetical protein